MKSKFLRRSVRCSAVSTCLAALSSAVFFAPPGARATDANGTWITDGNALWSDADTGNWTDGIVADGAGYTADFSTIDITLDRSVSLAAARTIGTIVFGDLDAATSAAGWTLNDNGNSANILTLDGTTPTITVNALGTGRVVTISAKIAGTLGLTKDGAGMLGLTGSNTYSGGTAINAGTLRIGIDNQLGAVPGVPEAANISINNGGKLLLGDGTNSPTLGATRGITLGSGMQSFVKWSRKSATINGVIAGVGGLNYDDNTAPGEDGGGGGRYQIGGANTYTGDTTITFKGIKDPGVVLNNKLAMQYSTLDYNTTNATGADLIWFSGGITNYTDGFTLGGLKGNKNLNLSPQGATAKNLRIGNNDQDTSYAGVISSSADASAGITKIGAGILTLTNANTYTGITKVEAGTLKLTHNNGIQNSAFDTSGAGALDITTTNTPTFGGLMGASSYALPANVTSLTLNPAAGITRTYSGALSGGTNLVLNKNNAGTQVLAGTNNYPGVTTINAGALVFGTTAALYGGNSADWTAAKIVVNSSGTFGVGVGGAGEFTHADITTTLLPNLTTGIANNGLKTGSAIGFDTSNAGGSFTLNAVIANSTGSAGFGAVGLGKYGSGTLVLTAVHTYTGNTTIAGGALVIDSTGQLGSGTYGSSIANSGTFTYNGAAAQTLSGAISGSGALTHAGAGTLTLAGSNSFTGPLTVEAATLTVATVNNAGANGPLGNSSLAVSLGKSGGLNGTLQYTGAGATSSKKFSLAAGGSGTFQVDTGAATLTLSATGAITGGGRLVKTGAGTLALTASGNNYTGNTTVSEGTLRISSNNTGNDLSTVTLAATGATLELNFPGTDTVDKLFIGDTQMPIGVYKAVGSAASGTELDQLAGTGTLTVTTGDAGASFATWASAFDPPLSNTAAAADPDNDGLENAVEYVLGTDPRYSNQGGPSSSVDGTNLILTFNRKDSSETTDVALQVQVSADLSDWTSLSGYSIGATTGTSTTPGVNVNEAGPDDTDIITVTIPMAPHAAKFARLTVAITP